MSSKNVPANETGAEGAKLTRYAPGIALDKVRGGDVAVMYSRADGEYVKLSDVLRSPAQADARVGLTDDRITEIYRDCRHPTVGWAHRFARAIEREASQPEPRAEVTDTDRLNWLRDEACDLRCIDMPTGAGDSEVRWIVVQHHMSKPHEREIGRSTTEEPREAIDAARAGASS